MADDRPWYREPETFIAVAALVVSVSAVVVGLYEASLQRRHDRAEVWPHLEISTFTTLQGVALRLDNTGIGPALVKSITVTVDGKSQHSWDEPLTTLYGHEPPPHSDLTVTEHALRAGDQLTVVGIGTKDLPPNFWKWIGRVSVSICYTSVFGEAWRVSDDYLGGSSTWKSVSSCPAQPKGFDL